MILSLAMSVNSQWPGSCEEKPDDRDTYDTAKQLLDEMINAGNLGSKGHGQMLVDVEAFQNGLFTVHSGAVDFQWDVDEWINQLLGA